MMRATLRRTSLLALACLGLALVSAVSASGAAAPPPSSLTGTWTVEQVPPGGTPRRSGTLVVTRNGNALTGTMRLEGTTVPLSNVSESDGIISFTARIPGNPGVTLNYSGAVRNNQIGMASQDLGR